MDKALAHHADMVRESASPGRSAPAHVRGLGEEALIDLLDACVPPPPEKTVYEKISPKLLK